MDTLTFQNRSLRDRAKRFEEALRRSTDEQIVVSAAWIRSRNRGAPPRTKHVGLVFLLMPELMCCSQEALAPYKHIEEDLKSLKEVLEMKNQQIHQQDIKISELEKIVSFKCLRWCAVGTFPRKRLVFKAVLSLLEVKLVLT